MKTLSKASMLLVAAMIMLLGGATACILGLLNQYGTTHFLKMLLIVLVVFYIFGCIIKIILDKVFAVSDEEETDGKEASEKVKENIESESDTQNDE